MGALSHLKILDLSRVLAVPWAGQLFGDLGAEVIKIERPGTGDDTRSWGPPFITGHGETRGDAAYFLAANRNKTSVTADIATDEGQRIVRALASEADVVIENFKVGGLVACGLDATSLTALERAGVPCGPINDMADVFADAQIIAREMRRDLDHPVAGKVPTVANPLRLSATPVTYRTSPPPLGDGDARILGRLKDSPRL